MPCADDPDDPFAKDLPNRWWKIPPEKRATYERNQGEFEAQFGDFSSVQIVRYGVAASPDGAWVGFDFFLKDGTRFRGALPSGDVNTNLVGMIMLALERCVVRGEAAASASIN